MLLALLCSWSAPSAADLTVVVSGDAGPASKSSPSVTRSTTTSRRPTPDRRSRSTSDPRDDGAAAGNAAAAATAAAASVVCATRSVAVSVLPSQTETDRSCPFSCHDVRPCPTSTVTAPHSDAYNRRSNVLCRCNARWLRPQLIESAGRVDPAGTSVSLALLSRRCHCNQTESDHLQHIQLWPS